MLSNVKYKLIVSFNKWRRYQYKKKTFYFIGFFHKYKDTEIVELLHSASRYNVKNILKRIDGNFAIIFKDANCFFASVDRISSYPFIYTIKNNQFYLSDNGKNIEENLKLNEDDIDYDITSTFAMSGYTTSNNTIYKKIKTFFPGEYVWIEGKKIDFNFYFTWKPWLDFKSSKKNKLNKLNDSIIQKLIKSCNGRQIVLPLSAGWDSRFIASGLRHFGYKNVICVTYGKDGSNDMQIAKEVAKKLNFKWIKIKYNKKEIKKIMNTKIYQDYVKSCDNLNAIYFMGEFFMLYQLKQNKFIKKDAIIVNGQSGDFISGNHIPIKIDNNTKSKKIVIEEYIQKHNKYWKVLMSDDRKKLAHKQLIHQINKLLIKDRGKKINMYGLYEALEFYNRQVKYVINGVSNYEYFNLDWRMPLWDFEYIQFWEKAPYCDKKQQNLYKRSIIEDDWANVWKNIPINPKLKISNFLFIIRIFCKLFFFNLGKKKWHSFERKYLQYFMDSFCNFAAWKYIDILFDKRGHYSPISWYIADYLERKKVCWNGKKKLRNKNI